MYVLVHHFSVFLSDYKIVKDLNIWYNSPLSSSPDTTAIDVTGVMSVLLFVLQEFTAFHTVWRLVYYHNEYAMLMLYMLAMITSLHTLVGRCM